jgi:THO complex subunit 2
MEIRNALIMLTKISSVFPVTLKSGTSLEKRVSYPYIKLGYFEHLCIFSKNVSSSM